MYMPTSGLTPAHRTTPFIAASGLRPDIIEHPEFDDHEQVEFIDDSTTGLRAIIAVHDTTLGAALGGVRMWNYASEAQALTDVLRLSRGMTYKSALAGLPLGGGKSVIIGDPRGSKQPELMRAMGDAIDALAGRYIGAEDVGITVADVEQMAYRTDHVAGIVRRRNADGTIRSGNPSPRTALGVFAGIAAAVRHRMGRTGLDGVAVAIQGVGSVGRRLAGLLRDVGATVYATDVHRPSLEDAVSEVGVIPVWHSDAIWNVPADVFAPCGLGGILGWDSIRRLNVAIVAGAANNQLATPADANRLLERGILYAPDYVINAGGIIDVYHGLVDTDAEESTGNVMAIGAVLTEIFERAEALQRSPAAIADELAIDRIAAAKSARHESA